MQTYEIAVIHGDGIGPEVCQSAIDVIQAAIGNSKVLEFTEYPAGAEHFLKTGDGAPKATMDACRKAAAILHGAAGLPGVVHPDGTEAGVDIGLGLRTQLDLYANVRPIKLREGIVSRLRDRDVGEIDYTIIREDSEGMYASRGAGAVVREEMAVDMLIVTRNGIERVCRSAFEIARKSNGAPRDGKKRVTCCDKANVLRSFAFFRRVFDEVGEQYPDVEKDYSYVDAMTVHLVERPDFYNVIVTENLFGDIISDLGAVTVGGMGMSPTAELGDHHGFFQAAHGSAPTIAGQGIANPYGTILAGAMMLHWLAERHGDASLTVTGNRIEAAVSRALAGGMKTRDIGGGALTKDVTAAVIGELRMSVEVA
jgi:3-isopropylmalate dehydrogenase